jgi:hypothetical protein
MTIVGIGKFRAKALGGNIGQSAKKGSKFVRAAFVLASGEDAGSAVEWTGYFSGAALERTLASLRYCGCTFPGDDITNLEGIDANEVEVDVQHEEYTYPEDHETRAGETVVRAKVAWVNSLAGSGMREEEQMDERALSSFSASMKGALIQAKKKTVVSSSPNAGRVTPPQRPSSQWDGQGADPSGLPEF